MDSPPPSFLRALQLALVSPRVWQFVRRPRTRYLLSWFCAVVAMTVIILTAWHAEDDAQRHDYGPGQGGNEGHATIDFGGQWLMGRMLVEGHGRQLYNRNHQREVLRRAYPAEHEAPPPKDEPPKSDVEKLMSWLMGYDNRHAADTVASFLSPLAASEPLSVSGLLVAGEEEWTEERLEKVLKPAVGGPLYPPVNGYYFYPLALLEPLTAYRVHQLLDLVLMLIAGLGIRQASGGRVWWPVGITLLALFPGFVPSIQLGQNALLTLTILVWGWVLLTREREVAAGVVWGLFAFKPVWALAFFFVPLLTGRWRTCLAMALTGAALAASTLPVVGLQTWRDWLAVGKEASDLYNYDESWIFLSRDLLGIPRRYLLDFRPEAPAREPYPLAAGLIGWGMLIGVLEATVRLAAQRRREARAGSGPAAAFLLLGAWMSCYHFMYYDVLLAALPLVLLLADFKPYLQRRYVALLFPSAEALGAGLDHYYEPRLPAELPPSAPLLRAGHRNLWLLNRVAPTLVAVFLLTGLMPITGLRRYKDLPLDTALLLVIWLWCGWLWIRRNNLESSPPELRLRFRARVAPTERETASEVHC